MKVWILCASTGFNGQVWVVMEKYGYLWASTVFFIESMGFMASQFFMDKNVLLWPSMGFYGQVWALMESKGLYRQVWVFMGKYGYL